MSYSIKIKDFQLSLNVYDSYHEQNLELSHEDFLKNKD